MKKFETFEEYKKKAINYAKKNLSSEDFKIFQEKLETTEEYADLIYNSYQNYDDIEDGVVDYIMNEFN